GLTSSYLPVGLLRGMANEAIAGFGRIIARHRHKWLRAFLEGPGGVASVCHGVERSSGAERTRFGTSASAYANATCTADSAIACCWKPVRRGACSKHPAACCAVRLVECDRASDHQRFRPAFASANPNQRYSAL